MPKPARPQTQDVPSKARLDLAQLRQDIGAAEDRVAAAARPVARLEAQIAAIDAADARAAETAREYALRLAEWAEAGQGDAPEPADPAAGGAGAARKAEAARTALDAARRGLESAERDLALLCGRVRPAVAAILREDGAALAAGWWRCRGQLERLGRQLAALDHVLAADFPTLHGPTGRPVVAFVSPEKLSAPDAMRALAATTADLPPLPALIQSWRETAAGLQQ
jgi:hypothetical protein